jgi:hypothetical protein
MTSTVTYITALSSGQLIKRYLTVLEKLTVPQAIKKFSAFSLQLDKKLHNSASFTEIK